MQLLIEKGAFSPYRTMIVNGKTPTNSFVSHGVLFAKEIYFFCNLYDIMLADVNWYGFFLFGLQVGSLHFPSGYSY